MDNISETCQNLQVSSVTSHCSFEIACFRVWLNLHIWPSVLLLLVCLGWTWRWGAVVDWLQGAGWAAQNEARVRVREKEDISLELVTVGRGRAPFQLAWRLYQGMCVTGGLGGAVHWAAPSASKAKRQSDAICVVDCGVVFLLTCHMFLFAFPTVHDHIYPFWNSCIFMFVYVCGLTKVLVVDSWPA